MITLLSLRFVPKKTYGILSWKKVLILGFIQASALLPGISRLATTYAAARWMGITPRRAFQFSHLMVVPLLGAECILSLPDIVVFYRYINITLLFLAACFVSYGLLHVSYWLALHEKLWLLGFYMLIPLAVLCCFWV